MDSHSLPLTTSHEGGHSRRKPMGTALLIVGLVALVGAAIMGASRANTIWQELTEPDYCDCPDRSNQTDPAWRTIESGSTVYWQVSCTFTTESTELQLVVPSADESTLTDHMTVDITACPQRFRETRQWGGAECPAVATLVFPPTPLTSLPHSTDEDHFTLLTLDADSPRYLLVTLTLDPLEQPDEKEREAEAVRVGVDAAGSEIEIIPLTPRRWLPVTGADMGVLALLALGLFATTSGTIVLRKARQKDAADDQRKASDAHNGMEVTP